MSMYAVCPSVLNGSQLIGHVITFLLQCSMCQVCNLESLESHKHQVAYGSNVVLPPYGRMYSKFKECNNGIYHF